MAPPVFKTGLAANIVAGGFDSLPPPPSIFLLGGRLMNGSHYTVILVPLKLVKVNPV